MIEAALAMALMGQAAKAAAEEFRGFLIPANRWGYRRLAKSRRIHIRRMKAAARRRRARHEG